MGIDRRGMSRPGDSTNPTSLVRATGHACAAVITLLVLAVADVVLRVPFESLARSAGDAAGMIALSVHGSVLHVAPLLLVQGAFVAGALALSRRPDLARWVVVLGAVAGAICGLRSYVLLLDYVEFRGYAPFIVAWTALGAYLAIAYTLSWASRPRRVRVAVATVGALGAVLAFWANATYFPGAYHALHRSLSTVVYLLGHASVVLALGARSGRGVPWSAPAAGAALLAVAMLAAGGASARATTFYRTFTTLGRGLAIEREAMLELCASPPAPLGEDEALQLFARHSRMPALPAAFRLTDYNVLLVTAEAMRYDETSPAGRGGSGGTPNLDRIARDGAFVFHDAMSPSSLTLQAFSSLHARTYPTHAPVTILNPHWRGHLRDDAVTIAEVFRDAGYATFAALHGEVHAGLAQGFREVHVVPDPEHTPTIDEQLLAWSVEALARRRAAGEKFFGWVFFWGPHTPYVERRAPTRSERERYRQEIAHTDAQLGKLYDYLRASSLLEDTVVIVTSDHGEEFGEHGGKAHGLTLHDEVLHVPLVVRLPRVRGAAIEELTSTLYVFPWLMSTGEGGMAPAVRQSIVEDLGPMMRETGGAVVAELFGGDRRVAALIWDEHKLIHHMTTGYVQIFDRRRDRREQRDLADRDPDLRAELGPPLRRYLAQRACRSRATVVAE